jgi:cobalamin biosynthesis protein CobT
MKRHIARKHDNDVPPKVRKLKGSTKIHNDYSDAEEAKHVNESSDGETENESRDRKSDDETENESTDGKSKDETENGYTDGEETSDEEAKEDDETDKDENLESLAEESDNSECDISTHENKAWKFFLASVLPNIEFETAEDLYKDEDTFKEVIKLLEKRVNFLTDIVDSIKCGTIYNAITEEEYRLVNQCKYKPFEAKKLAWSNRRYLLKKLLKDNTEFIADNFLSGQPTEDVKSLPVKDMENDWLWKLRNKNQAVNYQ